MYFLGWFFSQSPFVVLLCKDVSCALFVLSQVNLEGKASPLSLLQMASPSGFCALVRLPRLICGGKTLPRTLLDILADGTILKVGVGCSEDASKLLQDYGLIVRGCLDLRYLAMKQGYGLYACQDACSGGAEIVHAVVTGDRY